MQPLHLRPMEFGDILDGAFKLYRAEFVRLFTAALAANLPNLVFEVVVGGEADPNDLTASLSVLLLRMPLSLLTTALLYATLFHQADRALHGAPESAAAALRAGLRRFLPVLAVSALVGVMIMAGLLFLVVPGILVGLIFFAATPVVVVEGKGPIAALGRSRELSRGALGHIAAVLIVAGIIALMPTLGLSLIGAVLAGASTLAGGDPGMALMLLRVLQVLVSALIAPFTAGVWLLLYYDRRVRTEALDVQFAAERLAGSPAV